MSDTQAASLLKMQGITKFFPGVKALDGVDIELDRGEVLAVIGENGAGKSTLMKVLGGIHQQDAGRIFIDGREEIIDSVQKSTALGIAFVHQELILSDNLNIAENIFLGREPCSSKRLGLIDKKRLYQDAETYLEQLHITCSPRTIVSELTIGTQQMVEIAKALSIQARIIIMDEPTSSLSQHESQQLFRVIRELRDQGVAIIYISHRMGEVSDLADRVSVLRDGCISGHLKREEITLDRMIQLIVGRDIEQFYHQSHSASKEPVMQVRNFQVPGGAGVPLNLDVHAGEILVLAGLVGAGRTDLVHTLFGIDKPDAGQVSLDGQDVTINNPRDAIRAGMALVPEDRKLHGLIIEMAVEENLCLAALPEYQRHRVIQFERVRQLCERMVEKLDIRLSSLSQIAESLSGGNQQKVVLAKWLALNPKVMLLDEPTRGIDVVAKEEVYRLLEELASQNVAILVVSSEMQEVLGIADRIVVMHEGHISGELHKNEFSEEAVVRLATGGR